MKFAGVATLTVSTEQENKRYLTVEIGASCSNNAASGCLISSLTQHNGCRFFKEANVIMAPATHCPLTEFIPS